MIRAISVLLLCLAMPSVCAAQNWTPIKFKSNYGDEVDAEQTMIIVPERSARPGGAVIRLPVVRFRSTSPHPGPPIVYLAGGPGSSGVARAKQELFPVLMRLREVADVVVFDQRGTGNAEPSLGLPGNFDVPAGAGFDYPVAVARLRDIATNGAVAIRQRGIDLSAYNTVESAEDIERVRAALGVEQLAIWGHSYGSHLGLQYLRAHPDRVARAVLGGINDVDNRWRLPADSDALLARVDAALKAEPRLRERVPDFLGLVTRVMRQLDAKPQLVTVEGRQVMVGKVDLQALIAARGGDLEFVRSLPFLFTELDKGNFGQVAAQLLQLKQSPIGTAMRYAMHIASGVAPERAAEIRRQTETSLSGDAINFPFNVEGFVQAWGVADLGASFREKTPSNVPVLFMNGEFDGRTSVREAIETAGRFTNGSFTTILGASHDFYQFSPKVVEAMIGFFATGVAPPATIRVLDEEFWSPDEAPQLAELQSILTTKGVPATVARMREMAALAHGPYFNAPTARFFALTVGRTQKNPAAAAEILEAADRIWPDDFGIVRMLAETYRILGKTALARPRLQQLLKLNPITAEANAQLKALPQP